MQLGRRIVTFLASLSLVQLVLLGSGVPCASPMGDTGTHAAHAEEHASPADHADHSSANDAGDRDNVPAACGLRACTVSPLTTTSSVLLASAAPSPAVVFPAIHDAPASPARSLDPPPPRA